MSDIVRIEKLLDRLVTLMERNGDLYDQMIALLDEETASLKEADLTRLERTVEKKNGVASSLMALESDRLNTLTTLAKEMGVETTTVTLRSLAAAHPKREKALLALRERMNTQVAVVAEKNDFNRGLIAKLMSLNAEAAANLHALSQHDSVYGKGAKTSSTPLPAGKVVRRTL